MCVGLLGASETARDGPPIGVGVIPGLFNMSNTRIAGILSLGKSNAFSCKVPHQYQCKHKLGCWNTQ